MSTFIVEALRPVFPPPVQERGRQYFLAGAVEIHAAEPDAVQASVHGGERYDVRLKAAEPGWSGSCTCPASSKDGLCKHLWALILEVDAGRFDIALGYGAAPGGKPSRPRDAPAWQRRMKAVREAGKAREVDPWADLAPAELRVRYVVDPDATNSGNGLALALESERLLKNGGWGRLRNFDAATPGIRERLTPEDRELVAAVLAAVPWDSHAAHYRWSANHWVDYGALGDLLPRLCATGRFFLEGSGTPLVFDDGEPWLFGLELTRDKKRRQCVLVGYLARGGERLGPADAELLLASGFLFTSATVARLDPRGAWPWILAERDGGPVRAPLKDERALLDEVVRGPGRPLLSIPDRPPVETGDPRPCLRVHRGHDRQQRLECEISFGYGDERMNLADPRGMALVEDRIVYRDLSKERAALERFLHHGGERYSNPSREFDSCVQAKAMPALVGGLLEEGWTVEADGRRYRRAGTLSVSVRSGVDWFDLEGGLDFDGQVAPLPALLAAAREGKDTVRLGDGSLGILPEKWLEEWGLLDALAKPEGDALRFSRNQGWLLDALLAARPEVDVDARFEKLRHGLRSFEGIGPARAPRGFSGSLRPYQRDGLGWFAFLEELGFGGCLADDMGLGKTIQVLALLEGRRSKTREPRCSLVVAPKSLIFNWIAEAARFTPQLKVLDYTGPDRKQRLEELGDHHLALTTYGTLRRDILELKKHRFDYVILDEAQAIKNPQSQAAKAARLLEGDHRLALTGTPVENHLGDLWSLFEFLNPGMLGRAKVFADLSRGNGAPDGGALAQLAAALRPFILRRTKEQVLPDLPEKTEQTIYCEMEREQKAEYRRLRDHYRTSLLARTHNGGFGRMKIQVLEALLRLRQAACHPGLIDPARAELPAAKLGVLLERLEEVKESGHKALVFSQFTKLLAIVRRELDARGMAYEYLDGRTRKRKERVEHFQAAPAAECPFFLISLKAGGLGLNLTAADYIFLLDPWWNPAVERQAIDRAHRIGQTRKVLAYRLICRDTVEEKVVELQERKRDLADAIIRAEGGLLRDLTRDDLEQLLA